MSFNLLHISHDVCFIVIFSEGGFLISESINNVQDLDSLGISLINLVSAADIDLGFGFGDVGCKDFSSNSTEDLGYLEAIGNNFITRENVSVYLLIKGLKEVSLCLDVIEGFAFLKKLFPFLD